MKSSSFLFNLYLWSLLIVWSVVIGGLLMHGNAQIAQIQKEMARKEACVLFNKDKAFRLWGAMHGGVYVPATDETPPNPYLSHIPERDIKTPSGIQLTLMNPAYMLRQSMETYETLYGPRGHITSLKHFRKETAPDEWEIDALKKFHAGVKELSDFSTIDGKPYLRFMSPMITEEKCLKCHGHQGYKVGDVRGGVSISLSMAPYLANQRRQTITYSVSLGLLWLFGFAGIILASRKIKSEIEERDKAEVELQKAREQLERKVDNRTAELGELNIQLKHEIVERKKIEDALRLKTHHLQERIKELNCLYRISHLREKPGISIREMMMGTVDILAASWQFPEITCVRITLEGSVYTTENFKETKWKQASSIFVNQTLVGSIEVYYLEERPASDEGPFLNEERKLIDAVAVRLGRIVKYTQVLKDLQKANEVLEQRVGIRTQELESRTEQLRQLALRLTLAEERERRRIAGILHDDLQQLLVGAKMRLENLSMRINSDQKDEIEGIHNLLVETLQKSRVLTAELSPPALLHYDLIPALEWLATFVQQNYGLSIELQLDSRVIISRQDFKVMLFNCVRELLLNVVKHARVNTVFISMDVDNSGNLCIVVKDTGVGFDHERIRNNDERDIGYGLFSITERLTLFDGSFQVISSPGKGTECRMVAPLTTEELQRFEDLHLPDISDSVHPPGVDKKIRILLVDDHIVMREGLSSLLDTQSDFIILAEAADGEQAVNLARKLCPDVILMDINLPKMSGLEATRIISSEQPRTRIIGLSMYDDQKTISTMLNAGAAAYFKKDGSSDALLAAIRDCDETTSNGTQKRD